MPAKAREFWPELLWAALAVPIAVFDHRGGLFLAVFCTVILAIGWALGHRHRVMPLHGKVDRMTDMVGEMVEEMRDGRGEEETPRPHLHLVP